MWDKKNVITAYPVVLIWDHIYPCFYSGPDGTLWISSGGDPSHADLSLPIWKGDVSYLCGIPSSRQLATGPGCTCGEKRRVTLFLHQRLDRKDNTTWCCLMGILCCSSAWCAGPTPQTTHMVHLTGTEVPFPPFSICMIFSLQRVEIAAMPYFCRTGQGGENFFLHF